MTFQAVFEDFSRNKKALQGIHEDTLECFKKIQESLASNQHGRDLANQLVHAMNMAQSPPGNVDDLSEVEISFEGVETTHTSLADTLYTKEERDEVCKLFSPIHPSLIVVGQTNSGKSSIINEILGFKVVSTSDQPCTSRIVKMTHSNENYVRLVARDDKTLESIKTNGDKVPRDLIELKQRDRENSERVTAIVEAGFDIPFLKSGVDIIDSPGRNENAVLDDLVRKQLDNILSFIVYVIDGHNLFTIQDKADLEEIKSKGVLEILFVVSKTEPQEESDSSDKEEEEEEEEDVEDVEDYGTDKETVQESKKRRVYEQLIKNGHLSPEINMHSNDYFHGLSAWKLYDYRSKKKENPKWNDPDNAYKEYTDAFERFQSCLKTFSESCLKRCVKRSCQTLISVLSRCLHFFIEKANDLKQTRNATLAMLKSINKEEAIVHKNVTREVESQMQDIVEELGRSIQDLKKDEVVKDARAFQYSEEIAVPKTGCVKGTGAVKHCRMQIEQMVLNKVGKRLKKTLVTMFRRRDEFLEDLEKKVKKIEEEAFSEEQKSHATSKSLHSTLVVCYEPNIDSSSKSWSIIQILQRLREWLRCFFKQPLITLSGEVNVGDPKWKEKIALETFDGIDIHEIGAELVKKLNQHFESGHKKFVEEHKKILDVLKEGESLQDNQRKAILKFSPDVASLEMLCHSVNDLLKYGRPQKGELIGAGAQGNVFICSNIKTDEGKECVVKVVPVPNEGSLKDLTLELHTTRGLSHPNILPIVCTIIEPNSTGITVSIVSERMASDLHNALPRIPSLRERLKILLDIALAVQYLHKREIIHRDIKLQNVLVDKDNKGYLTDMGLCKAEGLQTGSLVGTITAMAPEMISRNYGKPVDTYAFGILMWRVCEGKGNQPANIFLFPVPIIMLVVNAKEDRRPERLDCFLPSCWRLMEKCWDTDPDKRPKFEEIVRELREILSYKSIQ